MINIADQLHAATEQGIVAAANEILDPVFGVRQTAVNLNTQKAFYGAIVFDNSDTGEDGITAVRFPDGDTVDYLCFITASGVRYYAPSMDEGAYVYYPNSEGYSQVGVVLTKIEPTSGGGGGNFDPNGTYPNLTAGNLAGYDNDGIKSVNNGKIVRTTGGSSSVSDGQARLTVIRGNVSNGIPFTAKKFKSIFFNLFDKGNQVLTDVAVSSGVIVASSGSSLGWCRVVEGEVSASSENETNNGIRILALDSATIGSVYYCATKPSVGASVTEITASYTYAGRKVYAAPADGYIAFEASSFEEIVIQNAWSHDCVSGTDAKDTAYSEDILELPLITHKNGAKYLAKANGVYDELDFTSKIATKRVEFDIFKELDWEEISEPHTRENDGEEETYYTYTYKASIGAKANTVNIELFGVPAGYSPTIDANGKLVVSAGETQLDIPTDDDWKNAIVYYELQTYVETALEGEAYFSEGDFGLELFFDYTDEEIAPSYMAAIYLVDMKNALRDITLRDAKDRSYSIPFAEYDLSAVETNMSGNITIKKIATHNIATLKYSIVNGVQNQTVDLSLSEQEIIISDGATVIWDITKTNGGQISSLGILYAYND